jgi:hypothetical protein
MNLEMLPRFLETLVPNCETQKALQRRPIQDRSSG